MNVTSLEKVRNAAFFLAQNQELVSIARPHLADTVGKAADILTQLSDGEFHTATELGASLSMNRTSIQQILKSLQWNPEEGGIILMANNGNTAIVGFKLPNGKVVWKPPVS